MLNSFLFDCNENKANKSLKNIDLDRKTTLKLLYFSFTY